MGSFFEIVLILVFSTIIAACHAAEGNTTSTSEERRAKALGIFSIVKFPNSACVGTSSFNGTCYTSEECTSKSGTASGSCASGFGVCCVFSLTCGGSIAENNTYHTITTFSSTTTTNPCTYTICPCSTNICKLRLDFETFTIAGPFTGINTVATFVANPAFPLGLSAGRCIYDSFTVTGTSDINTICGYNTGQHIYVDSLSTCNTLTIKVDTSRTYTRSWNIVATQVECGSEFATHDCLQYHTGTSSGGTFSSFNYETSNGVVVGATVHHLQSQDYDICFRQERGYCSICFDAVISTIATATSFGVSGNIVATAQQSAVDTQCTGIDLMQPTDPNFGAMGDYITIDNGGASPHTSSLTTGASRFCGLTFNAANGNAADTTVCTFVTPFKWGVTFNDQELWANPGKAALKTENWANDGSFGGLGFYMNWWLQAC